MISSWAIESLKEYVRVGRPAGDFLEAVLSNDLMDAFGRADYICRAEMFEYTKYVYNDMPLSCHGSRKIYNDWCKSGGLEGQKKEEL